MRVAFDPDWGVDTSVESNERFKRYMIHQLEKRDRRYIQTGVGVALYIIGMILCISAFESAARLTITTTSNVTT